ncbi:MAG TPA: hypothetical protein V6D29_17525 [Leptolyngbyaceae cyanobacterium]
MSLPVLLAIAIALGIVFWWRQKKGRGLPGGVPSLGRPNRSVYGQTRRQLLRMVGGNRATAERLLLQVRQRYPGRPEQWYWEKAIYDIQRDRRS